MTNLTGIVFNVHDYGAIGDGTTDDSTAISNTIAAALANAQPAIVVFENREYVVSKAIYNNIGTNQYLYIEGNNGRLLFASGFSGIGMTFPILATPSGTTAYQLPAVKISNLGFVSTWATLATNTALRIFTQNNSTGQLGPSVDLSGIRIDNSGTGDWQFGIDLFGVNVTRHRDLYFAGKSGSSSTHMRIDTDDRISVAHSISGVIANGGGTTLQLGHDGATGPLQGVSVVDFNVVCNNGIVWYGASNHDQLTVTNGQISCKQWGIFVESLTTVVVSNVYFLGCGTGILMRNSTANNASRTSRHSITGNTFYAGAPNSTTQPNWCIVVQDANGGPAGGTIISGNVFTNLYGAPSGSTLNAKPIQVTGTSNYVSVFSNVSLGNRAVNDTTGNVVNFSANNMESGDVNGLYFDSAPMFDGGITLSAPGMAKSNWGSINNTVGVLNLACQNVMVGSKGGGLGFFNAGKLANQGTITGNTSSGTATTLKNLITTLASYGLVVDGTTS